MHTDKTSFNNQKPGKPIDAGERDKNIEGQVEKPSGHDGGMKETRPGPGSEAPGQVAKM